MDIETDIREELKESFRATGNDLFDRADDEIAALRFELANYQGALTRLGKETKTDMAQFWKMLRDESLQRHFEKHGA